MTAAAANLPATRTDPTQLAKQLLDRALIDSVLAGQSGHTLRNYEADYRDFARFVGADAPGPALDLLIASGHGAANSLALSYRADLASRGLASSTIARRLSALRTAARVARLLGKVAWELAVEAPRVTPYRDTQGPGLAGWKKILRAATRNAKQSAAGKRDLALIRLLHDLALRRFEALGLGLEHVDLKRGVVMVKGKGKSDRIPLTLPRPTKEALAAWLKVRGRAPGPVFIRLRTGCSPLTPRPAPLSGESARRIVAALGVTADIERVVRPHGLRHQAITRALDLSGGDVRAVQKFSRHRKLETLMIYDDERRDIAGKLAVQVAED